MRIVPTLDELKDSSSGLVSGPESVPIQELAFQCGEETLTQGVVIGIADRSHRRPHAGLTAAFSEGQRSILASPVRVVDHAQRLPLVDGHLQGIQDQFRSQMVGHRPTDNSSAEGIDHHCQVQEPGPCSDIGYIGDPELVRPVGGEITLDQIGRRGFSRLSDRSTNPFPSANTLQARSTHETGHPLAPNSHSFIPQLLMHTRGAIGVSRSQVDVSDPVRQDGIFPGAFRRGALQPRIIAAGTPYGALEETSSKQHTMTTG